MKIALFYEHREIGSSGYYVERALGRLGHEVRHFRKQEIASARGFDLYVRTEDGEYGYAFSAAQRPAVYWTMDTHLAHSCRKILREASSYDFLFACHQSGVRLLESRGLAVSWLPVGCDLERHGRIDIPVEYDVSSIGKEEGIPRKFLLQEIRERYPHSFIKKADFRLMPRVYSASKIGFNQAINRDVNMRVFEVMAAGAMLLTSEVEDDSYEKLGFKDGEHFVIFKSPRDLFEKLEYYFANEDARRAIAERGRRLVCERHTYKHRMQAMIETLKEKGIVKDILPSRLNNVSV